MKEIIRQIAEAVENGKAKLIKELVPQAIEEGCSAQEILGEGLLPGMGVIGDKFSKNEVFVPEVLVSARAMNKGVELIKPLLQAEGQTSIGKVCIGTVEGDLHDIGKNIVKLMMESRNIEVVDLGADVSTDRFVEAVKNEGCEVVALSALLTTTMPVMGDVIKALTEAGLRDKVKVMIGGAPVNQQFADMIGADIYTDDGAQAGLACEKALKEMHA